MLPPRSSGCPSDLDLEEHLGAPDPAVADHAASCPHCGGWLEAAARIGDRFEERVAPVQFPHVEAILTRELGPPGRDRGRPRILAALRPLGLAAAALRPLGLAAAALRPLGLAAAALGVVLVAAVVLQAGRDPRPDISAKGGGLQVHVLSAAGARTVTAGEPVGEGDLLRFTVAPAGPRHVWVLSVDSRGTVSRLAPVSGDGGILLDRPGTLPGSAILDGAEGPERIIAVFSPSPLPWREVQEAAARAAAERPGPAGLRALGPLPLAGVEQSTVLLERP